MSGSGPNFGGSHGPNDGNTTSGTATGTTPTAPLLPYMTGLSLLDFNQLINDPIHHDPSWPAMPTKLPSYIPKFEGLVGEDPTNHVRYFNMWCSFNSITDDSFCLYLFQCTLTKVASKWYVDQASASHTTFATLS